MNNELICINNMTKSFGQRKILDRIDLTIERGQSIALLGRNGTGKSTLLRIIGGLTTISSGAIKYAKDIKFNYIPEHFPKMNITGMQYLRHMGLIEQIPDQIWKDQCLELVRAFHMENMLELPLKTLSKGTLQKVAVIQALLTKPDVLLLDEPLSGQDMQSQKKFISMINEIKQQGVTIIMSCHEMFLVNQISDIAYEIRKCKLEPITITKEVDYDILLFMNSSQAVLNPTITELAETVVTHQNEIKLVVGRDRSNDIILQMLKDGFVLRSMKGMEE